MGITFGGLASGLDTNAIISALLQVEALPLQKFGQQKEQNTSKLSLIKTLESHVTALQDAAEKLSKSGGFLSYSVQGSDDSAATFTLTGTQAAIGAHTFEITSLASADRYTFDTTAVVADAEQDLGGGTISFSYDGVDYDVAIGSGAGESGLNDVMAKINDAGGGNVSASVINVGTEKKPDYQLVISGNSTGADFAIEGLSTTVAGLDGMTNIGTAANAVAIVDGLTVERSGNVFDGVVAGLSFTATAETLGEASFTVAVDNEGVKANVQGFVDAYNSVMSFINGQNEYDPDKPEQPALFGDSVLSTVRSTINSALFNVDIQTVMADTTGYSTLGLVGVELQKDGTLSIDDEKFTEKMTGDLDSLMALFTGEEGGLMKKLDDAIETMTKTTSDALGNTLGGVFKRRKDTLNSLNKTIDKQVESLEMRLISVEQGLTQKFSALEKLMAGLNVQSQFLSTQFG